MATSGSTVPPPPPRVTGVEQADLAAVIEWLWDFYRSAVLQGFFFSQNNAPTANQITGLPDPAGTNLATAQQTANEAKLAAQAAQTTATSANDRTKNWRKGSVTVSDTNTVTTVTFATAEPDTNYSVFLQVKSFSGVTSTDPLLVTNKVYTTANFQFTINAAPGAGHSVTYEWFLVRDLDG